MTPATSVSDWGHLKQHVVLSYVNMGMINFIVIILRSPSLFRWDRLSHDLNNVNPEAGEVNTLSDEFVKVSNDTLDKQAPYRYASRKEQRSIDKPWLTKGISTSIAKKNTLYRKQLTTNNPSIIRQYKLIEISLPT